MGNFGYICNGCETAINEGELTVLKHFRHGKLLGETSGAYDGYGGVEEDDTYRGDNDGDTGHMTIHASEFDFVDSVFYDGKIYNGEPLKWMEYRQKKVAEGMKDLCDEMYAEWASLPDYEQIEVLSGTGAWHEYCYHRATDSKKKSVILSDSDPNQSWGNPRKKYTTPVKTR